MTIVMLQKRVGIMTSEQRDKHVQILSQNTEILINRYIKYKVWRIITLVHYAFRESDISKHHGSETITCAI